MINRGWGGAGVSISKLNDYDNFHTILLLILIAMCKTNYGGGGG